MIYHSALHKEIIPTKSNKIQKKDNIFVHDVFHSDHLPKKYDECDVLYSEIPWKDGFKIFEERAGVVSDRKYTNFLKQIYTIITNEKKKTALITGKHTLSYFPEPDYVYQTKINNAPALCITYFGLNIYNTKNEKSIILELCNRFGCIGDFCCGYGRVVKYAVKTGKKFIVSDYNSKCIEYINENI